MKSAKIGQISKSRCVLESPKSCLFEFGMKILGFAILIWQFFDKISKKQKISHVFFVCFYRYKIALKLAQNCKIAIFQTCLTLPFSNMSNFLKFGHFSAILACFSMIFEHNCRVLSTYQTTGWGTGTAPPTVVRGCSSGSPPCIYNT